MVRASRLPALLGFIGLLAWSPATVLGHVKCFSAVSKSQFQNCALIYDGVALYWRLDTKRMTITFALNMERSPGWFSIGISDGSAMEGADMAVVQYDSNTTKWAVGDYFSESFSKPKLDKLQNVRLPGQPRTKTDGSFYAVIERPLDSCDPEDLAVVFDTDVMVVFAFGDPGAPFGYHGPNRAHVFLRLWPSAAAMAPPPKRPSDTRNFTMSIRKQAIPRKETTYTCINVQLPSDHKYHLIRLFGFTGSPLVHHMVFGVCGRGTDGFRHPPGVPYDCLGMPGDCPDHFFGWAPGTGMQELPPNAGLPIGKTAYTQGTLQIHYNNIEGLSNQFDQETGFRVEMTRHLRKYDVGILQLGSIGFGIPPGVKGFTIPPSVCPSNCTRARMKRPVTLLQNHFHMHFTGMQAMTRHFRGNVELQPLGYRRWYNFEWQIGQSVLPQSRVLRPGDSLVTTCTYDTSSRTNVTRFGLSSQDEMCFNYLLYYPAIEDFQFCVGYSRQVTFTTCSTTEKVTSLLGPGNPAATASMLPKLMAAMKLGYIMAETQPFRPQPYVDQCGRVPDVLAVINASQPYLMP